MKGDGLMVKGERQATKGKVILTLRVLDELNAPDRSVLLEVFLQLFLVHIIAQAGDKQGLERIALV